MFSVQTDLLTQQSIGYVEINIVEAEIKSLLNNESLVCKNIYLSLKGPNLIGHCAE